jgi:hypothetical protein
MNFILKNKAADTLILAALLLLAAKHYLCSLKRTPINEI